MLTNASALSAEVCGAARSPRRKAVKEFLAQKLGVDLKVPSLVTGYAPGYAELWYLAAYQGEDIQALKVEVWRATRHLPNSK